MMTLTCDRCERTFEVDETAGAEKAACPHCGDVARIPRSAAMPTAPLHSASAIGVSGAERPRTDVAGAVGADGGEQTLAVVRQAMFRAHPFWFLIMLACIVGGLGMAGFFASSVAGSPLALVGLGIAAVGAIWWLAWWLAPHRWVKLTITTKRSIRQTGIVMRETSEVLHRHVTNVVIKQGAVDRLLNVGYLGLDTAGQGGEPGREPGRTNIEIEIYNIPKPYEVKSIIDKYRF